MSQRRVVQAGEVSYELHTLGWKAFQDLCVTIVGEIWGQTVQNFLPVKDAGRDGAFWGNWKIRSGEMFQGAFTVQCKFSSKPGKNLTLSDISEEFEKAKALGHSGLANNYILLTNAGLSGKAESKMKAEFQKIDGITHFAGYGADWICRVIRESRRLRMLVPMVYGLGDLSQILDERAYLQAREILSAMGDGLSKFVITDAYDRSAEAVEKHGFVLLLGEPASGKSTIAAALAIGAADLWDCSVVKVRHADDFVNHWNPNEPKQFFWADDVFGMTQFDQSTASRWNAAFTHVHAAIMKGARVVFTSRDYIYRSARRYLKETAFPLLQESQVVIHVQNLSKEEKEQILYNHIRRGRQPKDFRQKLKPFLPAVAAHERFLPEIARRLGDPLFTKHLRFHDASISEFVEKPLEFLKDVIRTLDSNSRSALALLFMRGGNLRSPLQLSADETNALQLMEGTIAGVREALNALKDSLVLQVFSQNQFWWRFKHPTVRDAFGALIIEDQELLDIYLLGTPVESLVYEISCGDVGIQGTKVIVPEDRFDTVLRRIEGLYVGPRASRDQLLWFLSFRCSKPFLERFLQHHPLFISSLRVWSFLRVVVEADVFATLHRFGLLPEEHRVRFVKAVEELAIETPDAHFLKDEGLRAIFKQEEIDSILLKVKTQLLPNLYDVISDWKLSFEPANNSPSSHFHDLASELEVYREEFSQDADSVRLIESGLESIQEAIDDLASDEDEEKNEHDDHYGRRLNPAKLLVERSIFDDVDDL